MTTQLIVTLPAWIDDVVNARGAVFADRDAQMSLAIALAAENVTRGGGPFGAAVFDGARCVAAGVNRVLDTGLSIAHAEIVAIMATQHALHEAAEAKRDHGALTLVTSAEPCCQCFGAIVWSGIDHVVCGATTADVEAIGFDEGPKPSAWQARLRERGISVTEHVQRDAACAVLSDYRARGGTLYGLRSPRLK